MVAVRRAVTALPVFLLAIGCSGGEGTISPSPGPSAPEPTEPEGSAAPTATREPARTPTATPLPVGTSTPPPVDPTPTLGADVTPTLPPHFLVRFRDADSGAPLAGVFAWLSDTEYGTSDAAGILRFYDAAETVDLSFAWTYAGSASGSPLTTREIVSELGISTSEPREVWLNDPSITAIGSTLSGTVTTSALDVDTRVLATVGNPHTDVTWTLGEGGGTADYEVRLYQPSWLLLSQVGYVPNLGGYTAENIPEAFKLYYTPGDGMDTTLSASFDRYVFPDPSGLDERMDHTFHDLQLALPDGSLVFFSDDAHPLDEEAAAAIPVPDLDGPGIPQDVPVELDVRMIYESADVRLGQRCRVAAVSPGATVPCALPAVHDVTVADALKAEALPGASLPFTSVGQATALQLDFVDRYRLLDRSRFVRRRWSIRQHDASAPLTVPRIPEGTFDWLGEPVAQPGQWEADQVYAWSYARAEGASGDRGQTETFRALPASAPDPFEPNNDLASATSATLSGDGWLTPLLNISGGDFDTFSFDLAETARIQAHLSTASEAMELWLLDAEGAPVGVAREGDDYLLDRDLAPGRYYLQTDSDGRPDFQTYRFTLWELSPYVDAHEPNDDQAHATPLQLGSSYSGVLEGEDVDVYRFTLDAPATVYFTAQLDRTDGWVQLLLLDSTFTLNAASGLAGGDARGVSSTLSAGTWYVELLGSGPAHLVDYGLQGQIALDATSEPNDTLGTAYGLPLNTSGPTGIVARGDVDTFSFEVTVPTLILAEVDPLGGLPNWGHSLILYNSAGEPVAEDTDGDATLEATAIFAPGAGYLQVKADPAALDLVYSPYLRAFTDPDEPNEGLEDAAPLPLVELQRHWLNGSGDVDVYAIDAPAFGELVFFGDTFGDPGDLDLRLYDSAGAPQVAGVDLNDGSYSLYTNVAAGRWYVSIAAPDAAGPVGYDVAAVVNE